MVLKANSICLCKDKRSALLSSDPTMTNSTASVCEEIRLDPSAGNAVEIADDYTKRKSVFRVKTSTGSECLFQAENNGVLRTWIQTIEDNLKILPTSQHRSISSSSVSTSTATAVAVTAMVGAGGIMSQDEDKSLKDGSRKMTLSRNRSPTGQSPATKSRKASTDGASGVITPGKDTKKTWKGKVARQWKKMHGSQSGAPTPSYPEGGSIGVPLEECPVTELEPRVPHIVKVCTSIVEERGLEIVGIYRVPGNNAAVTHLTELVNRPNSIDEWSRLDDPRWNDVNVVSSLLKSFFRKLPDPLFTLELYQVFIEASKIEDTTVRLSALKRLARTSLPESHLETLRLLCSHLCKVAEHSEQNKMEIRNLAIVFGPTLVRTSDDNMLSMVTDMSHQCRIVESILSNMDWFFHQEEFDFPDSNVDMDQVMSGLTCTEGTGEITHSFGSQRLLLSNLQKLEESGKMNVLSPSRDMSAKDIVSGIISAANRKMLRAATGGRDKATGKKDSLDGEVGRPDHSKSNHSSRRNSESVLQNAMAIAAAVPQLVVAGTGKPEAKAVEESNFPIETYTGLEEATAERIRRFENETKLMMMRTNRAEGTDICRTTSGRE